MATDFGLYSVSTIKRVVSKLKDEGILIVKKLSHSKWLQTNYYTINYHKLKQIFMPQVQEHEVVHAEPYRVCRRPLFLRECPDEKSKIHP